MEFRMFQSVAALGSLSLLVVVLELIRRRRLTDELWVPWLLIAVAPLVASLWVAPWARLAQWIGIAYEPSLLLGGGVLMCFAMALYLAVVVSELMRRNLRLAQQLALLEESVARLSARNASTATR